MSLSGVRQIWLLEIDQEVKEYNYVEEIILDALIPPMKGVTSPVNTTDGDTEPTSDRELNERTRERFREKIRNGDMFG